MAASLLYAILCFLPLSQFYQQALGRAQICLTVLQSLGNSTKGNAMNRARKIPVFFITKHYVMEQIFAMSMLRPS